MLPFVKYNRKTKISYIDGEAVAVKSGDTTYTVRVFFSIRKYLRKDSFMKEYEKTGDYSQCISKYCDYKRLVIFILGDIHTLTIHYDTPYLSPHIRLKDAIKVISFEYDFGNGEVYINENDVFMENGFVKDDLQLGRIFIDKKYIIVCRRSKVVIYNNKSMEEIKEIEIFPSLLTFTPNNVTICDTDKAQKFDRDFNLIKKYDM